MDGVVLWVECCWDVLCCGVEAELDLAAAVVELADEAFDVVLAEDCFCEESALTDEGVGVAVEVWLGPLSDGDGLGDCLLGWQEEGCCEEWEDDEVVWVGSGFGVHGSLWLEVAGGLGGMIAFGGVVATESQLRCWRNWWISISGYIRLVGREWFQFGRIGGFGGDFGGLRGFFACDGV